MYKVLVVDERSLEDLGQAILSDANNRGHSQSYSDISVVIKDWIKLQPEMPRYSVQTGKPF